MTCLDFDMEKEEVMDPQQEDRGSGFERLFLTVKGKVTQLLNKAIEWLKLVVMKQGYVTEETPIPLSTVYVPYSHEEAKLRLRRIPKSWYFDKGYISIGSVGIFHLSPKALRTLIAKVGISTPALGDSRAWSNLPPHISAVFRLIASNPLDEGENMNLEHEINSTMLPRSVWALYLALWDEADQARMCLNTKKIHEVAFHDEEAVHKAKAMRDIISANGRARTLVKQARRTRQSR